MAKVDELREILAEIDVLETVETFGAEVQEFTDWMSQLSGGKVSEWVSDDPTVQYELDTLKDAAFEFSNTLEEFAGQFEPLTKAAATADDVNKVVQSAKSLVTIIGRADEAVGAEKATQLASMLGAMKDLSALLTGLSLNPVIGAFIGLYVVALENAAIGLEQIEAYAARRNEIIKSRGGEIDLAAAIAARDEAAESAAEAQRVLQRRLDELYRRRGEIIASQQASQYRAALDHCASRNPEAMKHAIAAAAPHGGVVGNAPISGATLAGLEAWVESSTGAAFALMTRASAAPEGSPARARAIEQLERLNGARREVVARLRPLRDCVRGSLERYGFSTADARPVGGGRRRLVLAGGGAGIFAIAAVGLVLLLPGDGDEPDASPAGVESSSGDDPDPSLAPGSSLGDVDVTPTSSGSVISGIPDKPVLVHPCSAGIPEVAAGVVSLDNDNRKVCNVSAEANGGVQLHVEAQLNSGAAGFLDEFRSQRDDAVEVRPVEWSPEGEIRISQFPNPDDGWTAALWAYVIDTDPLGRDVFVWVQADGGAAGGPLGDTVASIGEQLRDALLDAQPAVG